MSDWNTTIIDEFRANGGKVGGNFEGAPLLLLHTTGAKTGQERVNPMMYRKVGDHYAVFASKAGAPTNPDWYHNLLANPETTVQVGRELRQVRARVADPDERARLWPEVVRLLSIFDTYQQRTEREIPLVILEPRGSHS